MDVGFVSVLAGAQLAARDLWKRIILPRLQKRFGKGSVKPKVAERPQSAPTTTVRTKPRQQKDAGAGRAAAKQKDKGPAKKAGKKAAPKRVPAKAKKRR
jgi:hypothetical protein